MNSESLNQSVYLIQHCYERGDSEDVKVIGIFASQSDAETVVERLRKQDGFKDAPDGFSIDSYVIGRCFWSDGFETVC